MKCRRPLHLEAPDVTPVVGLTHISSNSISRLFVIKPDRKSPTTGNIVRATVRPHLDVGCLLAVSLSLLMRAHRRQQRARKSQRVPTFSY